MKAFARTYWLELVLFAVALVGDLMVLPFLPEQVPVLWNLPARPASAPVFGCGAVPGRLSGAFRLACLF